MAGKQPLKDFFSNYAGFRFKSSASTWNEWRRLCRHQRWPGRKNDRNHEEREDAFRSFRIALTQSFNETFGQDENDADAWHKLCRAAGIPDIPMSLGQMKEVRRGRGLGIGSGSTDVL